IGKNSGARLVVHVIVEARPAERTGDRSPGGGSGQPERTSHDPLHRRGGQGTKFHAPVGGAHPVHDPRRRGAGREEARGSGTNPGRTPGRERYLPGRGNGAIPESGSTGQRRAPVGRSSGRGPHAVSE